MLLTVLVYIFSLFNPTPDDNVWLLNYSQAIEVAKEDDKPILIVFTGSDWCKNCIALEKEVFQDAAFLEYADNNLILLRVDFPRSKKNNSYPMDDASRSALADKYNPQGTFPFVVLVDNSEKAIANSGYVKGGWAAYLNFFEKHLP